MKYLNVMVCWLDDVINMRNAPLFGCTADKAFQANEFESANVMPEEHRSFLATRAVRYPVLGALCKSLRVFVKSFSLENASRH